MANTIRRLCIGAEVKEQHIYFVGGQQKIFIDGKQSVITIHSIDELEKHYLINTKVGDEIQVWKKIPKNNITTEEYFID
jgi:hypothetical protein